MESQFYELYDDEINKCSTQNQNLWQNWQKKEKQNYFQNTANAIKMKTTSIKWRQKRKKNQIKKIVWNV